MTATDWHCLPQKPNDPSFSTRHTQPTDALKGSPCATRGDYGNNGVMHSYVKRVDQRVYL